MQLSKREIWGRSDGGRIDLLKSCSRIVESIRCDDFDHDSNKDALTVEENQSDAEEIYDQYGISKICFNR